jgi:hypothetical protein
MAGSPQDLSIERLFASPDRHLFAFEGDRAILVTMDREAYCRSIFLDRRIQPAGPASQLPVGPLTAGLNASASTTPGPGWIFHIAHCGSTLLARALDLPAKSLVLREPLALRQLAVDRTLSPADRQARLRLAAALFGRRYRPEAPAIVKANVPVNFIAGEIMALAPAAPAIFLYFPLRPYLLAILRSEGHRTWVGNVTTQLEPALGGAVGEIGGLDVAERAAALWLAQLRLYAGLIAAFPNARSLDAETLFATPNPVLAAAAAHFGVGLTEPERDAIAGGALFSTYSKDPGRAFDNAARLAVQAESARLLEPEIGRARRWLDARLVGNPLPAALDRPLVGPAPALLA